MKECYGKKVLIVKVATLTHPANWLGGQRDQGPGVGLHVQEVYQSILTFRRGVAGYQEWCPWSIQPKIWFVILTHPSVPNKGQNWALQIGLGDGSQLHYQLPGTPILPNSRSPHLAVGGSHIWHQPVCVSYVCSCTWTLCQALLPSWHWVNVLAEEVHQLPLPIWHPAPPSRTCLDIRNSLGWNLLWEQTGTKIPRLNRQTIP